MKAFRMVTVGAVAAALVSIAVPAHATGTCLDPNLWRRCEAPAGQPGGCNVSVTDVPQVAPGGNPDGIGLDCG
jgi:hypothetical protein